MRLKRVKIFGFKTFADKTEIEVDGDLIAVVGPNGCGKSNLVDAILWGLGEGNARHLRAQSGTDVIFNGSTRRKPVGYAEVNLYFDNDDGSLAIPAGEVVITRKLTRSGDSDYQINRRSCRLRDILELLADSGLGRAGYSIVGQKEIDQALAASAEDRRAWIDEAAGVQRYRTRKIESLRRLASARDHLSRVSDILNEIESQREPLRQEAEVAKRYKAILSSLREVETGLLAVEVASALEDIEKFEKRIADGNKFVDSESLRAETLESNLKKLGETISTIESEIDAQRQLRQSGLTSLERAEAAIQLGQQRLESLDELEQSLHEEHEQSSARRSELESEIAVLEEEWNREREQLKNIAKDSEGRKGEGAELGKQLAQAERELSDARHAQEKWLKDQAAAQHRTQRTKEISRERKGIEETLPETETALAEAVAAAKEAEEALSHHLREIKELEEAAETIRQEDESRATALRDSLRELALLEGRRKGIEATIDSHEGLTQGSRFVMEASRRGELSGEYTPVGEAISVEKEISLAIEVALGGAINDLIVPTEREAKSAIELLKQRRGGRATFQPISLMRPVRRMPEMDQLCRQPRVLGVASDLVRCDREFEPVIQSLLGRVVIVEDLDTALRLGKTGGWSRLVTLEGDVMHHSGSVSGGHGSKPTYGMVQRKADLEALAAQIASIEKSTAKSRKDHEAAVAKREELLAKRAELRETSKDLQSAFDEARKWSNSVQQERDQTVRSLARLETELQGLMSHVAPEEFSYDFEALGTKRDQLIREVASHSADSEATLARLRECEFRCAQAEDRVRSAHRRLEAANEGTQSRQKRLERLSPDRERIRQENLQATEARETAKIAAANAERLMEQNLTSKRELLEENYQKSEEIKGIRQSITASMDGLHQAELGRARAEAKRANSLQRLMEEYGLSEDEAVQMAPSVELPEDCQATTSRLRRELKAMGDVNVGAIEAFERLSERSDELTAQRADVEGGIAEVESSIRELDKLTRDKFKDAFEQVQEAFAVLFTRLFGGGEGQLILTNPDNLLESGIDVDVTLPGKKKQRLELLSGGERSLCASAFLFALLKVKPSPLVILDEVDAPLDGRNVERFCELLKEFSSGTVWQPADGASPIRSDAKKGPQFIVITHNVATSAAANVLFGVTMQEPGVSSLVPLKLNQTAAAAVSLA